MWSRASQYCAMQSRDMRMSWEGMNLSVSVLLETVSVSNEIVLQVGPFLSPEIIPLQETGHVPSLKPKAAT